MNNSGISLCLSGGGSRAMAYHAGLLEFLAKQEQLENVQRISSVSGGTLLIGLIFSLNNGKWPTSEQFLKSILPLVEQKLSQSSLQAKSLSLLLFRPSKWKYLLSRANILALTLEKEWNVRINISDLPTTPEWSLNGTTAETGKRFRFKNGQFGDYMTGYADASKFPLSKAMATSAAYPGGIGPLVLHTHDYKWKKKKSWGDKEFSEHIPDLKKIHVYDGGLYDNLGVEPFFDNGSGALKKEDSTTLIVSDAGSPIGQSFSKNPLNIFRLIRVVEILMDQTRSLRVRSLMKYFINQNGSGGYLMISSGSNELAHSYSQDTPINNKWLTPSEVETVANYPTNLKRVSSEDFRLIKRHAREQCEAIQKATGNLLGQHKSLQVI